MIQHLHWQLSGYPTRQLVHVCCILSTKWDVDKTAAGGCSFLVSRASLLPTCFRLCKVCTETSSYYSVSDQPTCGSETAHDERQDTECLLFCLTPHLGPAQAQWSADAVLGSYLLFVLPIQFL